MIRLCAVSLLAGIILFPEIGHAAATIRVPADHKTIQSAANAAKPGDTVVVAPGQYGERVKFKKGGEAGNPITIRSEKPREAIMGGFDTNGASHLRIEGFSIKPTEGDGVFIASDDIEIENNFFHDFPGSAVRATKDHNKITIRNNKALRCQRGFMVKGKNWLVEDNEVERLVYTNGEPDYVDFFGEGHIIRRNKFFGTLEAEIGKGHVDGFQTFAEGAQNCIIEENYVAGIHQGVILEAGKALGTHGIIIRHNIFVDPWAWGILLKNDSEAVIENNLIYHSFIHGIGVREADGGPSKAKIRGNIIVDSRSFIWREDHCTLDSDYNLGFRIAKMDKMGPHDIIADPLFTDAPKDFTLLPGSPALRAMESGGNMGPKMIWPAEKKNQN